MQDVDNSGPSASLRSFHPGARLREVAAVLSVKSTRRATPLLVFWARDVSKKSVKHGKWYCTATYYNSSFLNHIIHEEKRVLKTANCKAFFYTVQNLNMDVENRPWEDHFARTFAGVLHVHIGECACRSNHIPSGHPCPCFRTQKTLRIRAKLREEVLQVLKTCIVGDVVAKHHLSRGERVET